MSLQKNAKDVFCFEERFCTDILCIGLKRGRQRKLRRNEGAARNLQVPGCVFFTDFYLASNCVDKDWCKWDNIKVIIVYSYHSNFINGLREKPLINSYYYRNAVASKGSLVADSREENS